MSFTRIFLVTSLIAIFAGCQKTALTSNREESTSSNNLLLKKVVITRYDNEIFSIEYTYNSRNKPVKVAFSSSAYNWKSIVEIEYDAAAKLKTAIYKTINDNNSFKQDVVSYTYIYNNNRITKRLATPLKPDHDEDDHFYSYDTLGRLTTDSTVNRQTSKVKRYFNYRWDNNDNVTKIEDFVANDNGTFSLVTYREFSYDIYNNPYPTLESYFVYDYIAIYLSKNNIVSSKQEGSIGENYKNEYNGSLRKTLYSPITSPAFFSIYEYFYY
jgi:hypothetical protein